MLTLRKQFEQEILALKTNLWQIIIPLGDWIPFVHIRKNQDYILCAEYDTHGLLMGIMG